MSGLNYLLISPGDPKTIAQTSTPMMAQRMAAFPAGLAYVSSAMKGAGLKTFTVNSSFAGSDMESTLRRVIAVNDIGVVCTGGTSLDVHELKSLVGIVRGISPEITIVVGGAIISADPETAMNVMKADIGIIGEGEEAMCELAEALNSGRDFADVPGLVFRQNGALKVSPARSEVGDIEKLPFMDFNGFAYDEWLKTNDHSGIVYSARSCPFQCTFCYKSTGKRYRQRSLDSVFMEIDYQVQRHHIRTLSICDELFATKKERVYEFCERIRPYRLHWGASLRVAEIDTELLQLMSDAGCNGISTGLESGAPEVLKSMRKGITAEQLDRALDVFAKSRICMIGNFIFGDVVESKETVKTTLDMWRKHNHDLYMNLGIVATFPGSPNYEMACRRNIITNREEYLNAGDFIINITGMNDAEYYEMISQITELGYLPQAPARTVSIRDVNAEGCCEVEWQCRRCGRTSRLHHTHFLQASFCSCPCGVQNMVEPFRGVSCKSVELTAALPADGMVAFWGVGSQYCRLARHYECLNSDRFIQIDASRHHQRMTRLGKKIHGPDIIEKEGIHSVVITSPTAKKSILGAIKIGHHSIRKVFFPALLHTGNEFVPTFQPLFER